MSLSELFRNGGKTDIDSTRGITAQTINRVNPYILVDDAYHSSGGFRDGSYLVEHERERDFTERCGYSYYLNYFRPILDALVNPIFKRPPERTFKSAKYKLFVEDCDKSGTNLDRFMKKIAKSAKQDGVTYIVMDNNSEQPLSEAEVIENRAIPYIYQKTAIKVVKWMVGREGKLLEITFEEYSEAIEGGEETEIQYRHWYHGGWAVYKKFENNELKELIEEGETPNGLFPIISVFMAEQDDETYMPLPPLFDIARTNAAIFNVCSELREVQRKQGFSILAVPKMGGDNGKAQEIGTTSALGFPAEAKHAPHFIQPDVEVQEGYMKERDKLIEEIYKQAKLAGVTGIVEQSGISKQWDFEATDTELAETAKNIEAAEIQLAELFEAWTKKPITDFNVSYPETFGILDIDEDISRTEGFLSIGYPVDVATEAKAQLAISFFNYLDPKSRDELIDSVRKNGIETEIAKETTKESTETEQ